MRITYIGPFAIDLRTVGDTYVTVQPGDECPPGVDTTALHTVWAADGQPIPWVPPTSPDDATPVAEPTPDAPDMPPTSPDDATPVAEPTPDAPDATPTTSRKVK
jgi:hypothetical protein